MSASRCVKLLLLVTLLPLALRAASLLLAGHAVPASSSSHRHSSIRSSATGDAPTTASAAGSARGRPIRQPRHRRRTEGALAALNGARRLRQADADGGGVWFEDDKRLAPTGSNPLHNLR
ncbi:hypothetical protein SEVIR_5G117500v4 [Setaria viridis]|uniref:Uncharacterized protein n=2 Tax=Setaria TaxID=4554 RepID=K3XS05_SETIT|nr:uncharacterized protein LOC101766249 [Setaria italica]XP_034593993.1 uncharacterized protein LOC117855723 [Setaria viridis]RCV24866.1 hypothetical protein SETIT_5G121000v2 [Setaria italica]TKW13681.1 hypothetical protein SEVIR_5G117500v2 [Setaria viridis]